MPLLYDADKKTLKQTPESEAEGGGGIWTVRLVVSSGTKKSETR